MNKNIIISLNHKEYDLVLDLLQSFDFFANCPSDCFVPGTNKLVSDLIYKLRNSYCTSKQLFINF